MKIKVKKHAYNKETGETWVQVKTKYGQFEATAKPDTEDFEYRSQFVGGDIAVMKCQIKALKKKKKILKERYKGMMHGKQVLEDCPPAYTNIALNYLKGVHAIEDEIALIEQDIVASAVANKLSREKILKKVKK